jgi:guanosine-3',5'-bis(diphosphate) 3'-pyrophosphohydrolase
MTPAEPARLAPAPVDETVPDYVRALQRATDYLPEDQQRLLQRAWSVGAAAHAGLIATLLAGG